MTVSPFILLTDTIGKKPKILVLRTDIVLDPSQSEFSSTKLRKVSVLSLHKLATIHTTRLKRRLGEISSSTTKEVKSRLRDFLGI
ncbi:type II toxin-antitoxin system PemK/MazF family toxin [candidate division KSB1 bacterium]|nr:type II toxin-antitoxin system PemK/MazF family toxin [candidate division KSB1 bacterium]NIR70690.1 type II toxin-antitoxin system PemK/MazF family toxin [candidate division KSB1 bacterium]NIS27754.1 type II toxin-antitoxin system PemK/MazF family toxin [candidate division KSB1 bacterium]NIT74601.1 type II toxin-antitoxin system PemK/MazF family toxin [candidate division KSB1 bacterium]NIU28421.1 type II toxin-antitoxin system PemK/MazF family toxin [candidate division KSB1 bacterium]